MSAKEKAKECPLQDSVDGLRWAEAMASRFALDSGELLPWTCMMIETAKQFGYRTALEWVLCELKVGYLSDETQRFIFEIRQLVKKELGDE